MALLGLCALLLQGCGPSSVPQKTPYIALTVAQHARINLSEDKDDFADTLAKYFGMSHQEGLQVIEFAHQHRTMNSLVRSVADELNGAAQEMQGMEPRQAQEYFAANMLDPYLQCVLHQIELPVSVVENVHAGFRKVFADTAARSRLESLVASMQNYQTGGYFQADSLNRLNDFLQARGYVLQLDNRHLQMCVFSRDQVLLDNLKWGADSFSVVLVKREIPCLLPGEYGYSTMGSQRVVVIEDALREQAQEYHRRLDAGNVELFYPDPAVFALWSRMGLSLSLTDGNRIAAALIQRDFGSQGVDAILRALEIETALHEAKHKADEFDIPSLTINFDSEISAHLAEAICSTSPFHSLYSTIRRVEGFYASSDDARMGQMLKVLWGIAGKAEQPTYSADQLRLDLQKAYEGYIAESNNAHLVDLQKFRNEVAPRIIAAVATD